LDYHLFPGLKKQLKVHHFSSGTEVNAAADTWLDGKSSDFFNGLQTLEQRAKKCTELRGINSKFGRCSLFPSWSS
jgi:hypothetical protein